MRRLLALTALAGPLALAAPALGATVPQNGPQLAGILKENPVFADPRARPTLTAAQAEQARLRIVERAPGRIMIAVVPDRVALAAGGVRGLGRAIDRDLDINGALLVLASNSAWVVVSYDNPDLAVRAVRAAFAGKGSFDSHVLAAVDRLAAADPGPGSGSATGSGGPSTTTAPHVATDVRNAVKTLFIIIVAGVLGLPLLILTIGLARRGRRRRVNDRQPGGLEVSSPATPPTDLDAQRQAAEKAFGTDDS